MKKLLMLITAIAVMFGGLAIVAPAANANESVEIVITGEDSAVVEESVELKETARARADGKVQLSYFNPNAKGWSLAKAKKCKLISVSIKWSATKIKRVVKANKRKVNGTWCVRLKHGSTWANSGKEGKRDVPFTATVRGQWSLMTLKYPARGIWVHQGEFSGGKFFQVCENWWKIGVKPVLTDQQVVMVRSEAEVEYRNDWKLGAQVKGTLYATYKCGGATIEIDASVKAWAYDEGSFYLKASSLAQAKARGGEKVSAMSLASVKATAEHSAMVGAEYELRLKATCTEEPQDENHRPQAELQDLAHVEAGKTVGIEGCARDEDGDTLTVPTPTVSPSSLGRIDGWRRLDASEPTTCQPGWTAFEGTFWSNSQPTWADGHEEVATITMTATDPDNLSGTATETIRVRKVVHPET